MTYVKWGLAGLIVLCIGLFLHYTLPSRDIVKIVGTDVKRMDIDGTISSFFWANADAGTNQSGTRDVRFINVELPNGKPFVYRNEDTDWGWPPYLKFNSGNVTAQAQGLAKQDGDVWVAITHYGWRIKILTIFPNAISIKKVSGPNVFLIPWFNIIFFVVLAILLFLVWRAVQRFKKRNIDPVLENIETTVDDMAESADTARQQASAQATAAKKGFLSWFKRWFGETK